jgi:choline dehydrogenase-like flavoprotein
MHADLDAGFPDPAKASFDVCVFGTGPAGLTVALELAKSGKRIALVEAGAFEYANESQEIYAGTETGLKAWNSLSIARLRYFGGTSGHWAGLCGLQSEIDFSADTYHGLPGWPITRKDVLEHLPRAIEILDLVRPDFASTPVKAGLQSSFLLRGTALSPPTRFGRKYRASVVESSNIQLLTRANLVEFRLAVRSGGNASMDHAVLKNYKGQAFRISAGRFVLALGAIENARLLLNSDKQAPGGIGNHAGYVGRCFMEHLNVRIGRFVVRDKSYFSDKALSLTATDDVARSQRIGSGMLTAHPSFVPVDTGRTKAIKRILREEVCEFETIRDYARRFEDFDCVGEGVITSLIEQSPNPDSRISLNAGVDPLGLRRVDLHWAINDADRRTIRILGMELAKELARIDVARVQLSDFMIDKSRPVPVYPHAHHMGTTRMSADPRHGVVDENCRVHGVSNLYVAGASVFPVGGGINPTLTIVLLAARLAKHLERLA